jgi:SAM-dependent methyltransferase
MNAQDQITDIATVAHWESVWGGTSAVHGFSKFNYYDRRIGDLLGKFTSSNSRVLELGCGGSRWIEFFEKWIGCEAWGIDYSPKGLRITRAANPASPRVHLIEGDVFDRSLLPLGYFDFIYSLGFVEHFLETSTVMKRIAELLAPGGTVMTLVPNFCGPYGAIQKWIEPGIFSKHVVMDGRTLDRVHTNEGLSAVMPGSFWGCFGPGVVDYGARGRFILPPIKLLQHLTCWCLAGLHLDGESRLTSPYVVGVYQKFK